MKCPHTIELSDAQFDFIQRTVRVGGFRDAREVLDEAFRLLETRLVEGTDHIALMRAELQKRFDDYEAGRFTDLGTGEERAAYFEDVIRRGLERLAEARYNAFPEVNEVTIARQLPFHPLTDTSKLEILGTCPPESQRNQSYPSNASKARFT